MAPAGQTPNTINPDAGRIIFHPPVVVVRFGLLIRRMKQLFLALTLFSAVVLFGCRKEEGCTYPTACNFNSDAVLDDGSCDFTSCAGCTDSDALNFDPLATLDDGSCAYDHAATTADCVSSLNFDNYDYPVVAIGGQCWFAANLRSTVYRDGTNIPEEQAANFPNLDTPALTSYNTSSSTFNAQGYLYNGIAATTTQHGGLCPAGWHVPTELDWMELESYLVVAGQGKRMGEVLKAESGWAQSGNGTDTYGFNGSGGGNAWPDGGTYSLNYFGTYWSSTSTSNGNVMQRTLGSGSNQLDRQSYWDVTGCSVRCIED